MEESDGDGNIGAGIERAIAIKWVFANADLMVSLSYVLAPRKYAYSVDGSRNYGAIQIQLNVLGDKFGGERSQRLQGNVNIDEH